jgi:hypothetical protein
MSSITLPVAPNERSAVAKAEALEQQARAPVKRTRKIIVASAKRRSRPCPGGLEQPTTAGLARRVSPTTSYKLSRKLFSQLTGF